jgi:hypothetical protein
MRGRFFIARSNTEATETIDGVEQVIKLVASRAIFSETIEPGPGALSRLAD